MGRREESHRCCVDEVEGMVTGGEDGEIRPGSGTGLSRRSSSSSGGGSEEQEPGTGAAAAAAAAATLVVLRRTWSYAH
ncbi:hypothetical protein ABVT39_000892 [Epinephelus coioides]